MHNFEYFMRLKIQVFLLNFLIYNMEVSTIKKKGSINILQQI